MFDLHDIWNLIFDSANSRVNVKSAAQPGVDVGDVTVNNAAGAGAVNVQDGGNSITVDGTVTATPSGTQDTNVTQLGGAAIAAGSGVVGTGTQRVVLATDVALPAGTNAIGKLSANSGVDIGDVDVTSVLPGTGATNLGKAIDTVTGATDTGVLVLATRDDALSALTPIEGDNVQFRLDANGALWTHDDVLEAALAGSEFQVDIVAALPAGTNAIGKLAANSGVDIGDVDILSSALPSGASTAANQTTEIGDLDALNSLAGAAVTVPTQITKTVAAIATPEVLAADGTFFRRATLIGKKAARTNNVGIVYLGIGITNDTQALEINPNEVITIEAPPGEKYDLNDWGLDVLNAGDGVIIIYS